MGLLNTFHWRCSSRILIRMMTNRVLKASHLNFPQRSNFSENLSLIRYWGSIGFREEFLNLQFQTFLNFLWENDILIACLFLTFFLEKFTWSNKKIASLSHAVLKISTKLFILTVNSCLKIERAKEPNMACGKIWWQRRINLPGKGKWKKYN